MQTIYSKNKNLLYKEVYELRDLEYTKKEKIIQLLVSGINDNNLSIECWKNEDVVYFQYEGKQVSFHSKNESKIKNIPSKKWKWSKVKNEKKPFEAI